MSGSGRRMPPGRHGLPSRAPAGRLLVLGVLLAAGCRAGPDVADTGNAPPAAGGRGTWPVAAAPAGSAAAKDGVVPARYTPPDPRDQDAPGGDNGAVLELPGLRPVLAATPLDLPSALRLAGVENPTIALAEEAVRAALAEQLRARVLLVPDLTAGFNYDYHQGTLQAAKGIIRNVDRQALYAGLGAGAIVAGTVGFPGIRITAQLADAVYDPRAARQAVAGRRYDAVATRHNLLLEVALRYLDLEAAQARLLALRQSELDFGKVAQITDEFAKIGLGRPSDADRARTELTLLHAAEERAEEDIGVQAAELARLLNLDPSLRPRAAGGLIAPLQLVDARQDLEALVQTALASRPELGARSADVAVAETRLRKEQVRPFVPFISMGFSAGDFGGGSNLADTNFGHFRGRTDVDALAVWSFQNLGLGNLAIQRRMRADVRSAMAERTRVADLVRREVAEAYALVRQRRLEIDIARKRVETAAEAYRLDLIRVRNNQGRPIEVLNSARLLNTARQDLIGATVGYNQAQFQLLVALGNPPG